MRVLEVGGAALGDMPDLASLTGEPAHARIEGWLLSRMRRGAVRLGDKLPAEGDLASALGISRMTLRQALAALESRGRLKRVRGRAGGSFVTLPKLDVDLTGLSGFTAQMRHAQMRAGARVVRAGLVEPTAEVARGLELRRGAEAIEVVRVRSADREPLALEKSYLPAARFPGLLDRRLSGSLYAMMREHYGLAPHHAQEWLEPEIVADDHASLLGVDAGVAVMLVTRQAMTDTGLPVEYARDRYRADRARITLRTGLS
ncbi:MAG: GntR family transcriptional regulator [Aeromicrobium sp.]